MGNDCQLLLLPRRLGDDQVDPLDAADDAGTVLVGHDRGLALAGIELIGRHRNDQPVAELGQPVDQVEVADVEHVPSTRHVTHDGGAHDAADTNDGVHRPQRLAQLRDRYGILTPMEPDGTPRIDAGFLERLARFSGVPEKEIQTIFTHYNNCIRYEPNEEMLVDLHLAIERFEMAAK